MTDDPHAFVDRQERPVEHRQDIIGHESPERRQGFPEASYGAPDDDRETVESEPSIKTIIARLRVPHAQAGNVYEQVAFTAPFARSSFQETVEKPSLAPSSRAISRVCYTNTPHKRAGDSQLSPSDRLKKRRQRCYTNAPHNRVVGVVLRDGLYYVRRRVPDALRPIIGRSEIWRSLRTDSARVAARRLRQSTASL